MSDRFPVLISKSSNTPYIAELLDGPAVRAMADSAGKVCQVLEKKLKAMSKRRAVVPSTDWASVEIFTKSFPVQPMHLIQGRRHLAGPRIQFPVRYAKLIDNKGALFCVLPDLGEQFYCPDDRLFATMLADSVRSMTASISPDEIWKLWPPPEQELRWVRVVSRPLGMGRSASMRLETLPTVAEPLLQKTHLFIPSPEHASTHIALQEAMGSQGGLLVGEPGVGKSATITYFARQMQRAERERLKLQRTNRRTPREERQPLFWLSSGGRLIAGMQYLGQWQARVERVIAELSDTGAMIVFENLRDLLTLGSGSPRDSLGAFMLPYVKSGQLRLMAESSPQELDVCRRLLPSFIDALPIIRMPSLSPTAETAILKQLAELDAKNRKSSFDPAIPQTIQRWTAQYQRHASPPGPAVEFLRALQANKPARLEMEQAVSLFLKRTGLPEVLLRHELTLEREEVAAALRREVIGQEQACFAAAGLVTRIKSAMNDPQRPFGCMLLCGPTGVGKTQLAKSLAHYLFGHADVSTPLVRLDMSEYAGVAAGHRFLLDGEGQPADWIQKIRMRPLSVLLLDEIEKAGTEVFDILLSLLDEGRLTDRMGRTTSFRNSLVLMTSNLGGSVPATAGFGESTGPNYLSEVRRAFRPEFFNRLDQVITFRPLTPNMIEQITRKELRDLNLRDGMVRQGLTLEFTDRLVTHLSQVGFDAKLGARPLQRTIESLLVAPLAKWMLTTQQRVTKLRLDWDQGLIMLQVAD